MSTRRAHPIAFLFLILPFGAMGGYLTVALAYLLSKAGLSVGAIAGLVAISYIPHTWKFAWAPIADTTLSRRAWYLIGSVASAAGMWLMGALPATPANVPVLSAIVLIANVAVTFLGMSVESLMAYGTSDEQKGRAGGWFLAGNLGGQGVGGGAGLWLAQVLPAPWMAGAGLGVACLLCAIPILFIAEPEAAHRHARFTESLRNVVRDLWNVARSRLGYLALFLCFLPIGSGAAANLWSAVAGDWRASANTVALVTGVFGGFVMAGGCIVGGWLSDRMDRKMSYALYGVLQALCAIGMGLAPRTETSYVVFTMLYAFVTGLTYAGFSAFVLEAMGKGAAATKYSVFASLSNTPIWYMTLVDGAAHTRWGPAGMLFAEATLCFVGLALFLVVQALAARSAPPAEAAS
ncbi:MAG TPA: MFS transporter [Candidatus Saccharimonadaceae bacterium]|nr:MFS transporter [Candidatus Saccharimonadaceae bacterium]